MPDTWSNLFKSRKTGRTRRLKFVEKGDGTASVFHGAKRVGTRDTGSFWYQSEKAKGTAGTGRKKRWQ